MKEQTCKDITEGILVVERIVLECLEKSSRDLGQIQEDTGLGYKFLVNILSYLIERGMVKYENSQYCLNLDQKKDWIHHLQDQSSIKEEVKELFSSLVNEYYREELKQKTSLNVQKIWLTEKEKRSLDFKLQDINDFIHKIKNNRKFYPEKEKTREKQVLIWGISPYQSLMEGLLRTI